MRSHTLLFFGALFIFSCTEDTVTPVEKPAKFVAYTDSEYEVISSELNLPRRLDDYDDGSGFLKSTTKGTLGRVLFYDTQLSEDMSVSCASCHDQKHAFADPVDFSTGIFGRTTARNSIGLGSFVAFNEEYGEGGSGGLSLTAPSKPLFWDMRAASIHQQMEETIANEDEMGMSTTEVANRLKGQEHYEILFKKAYGNTDITEGRILEALKTFMLSIKAENTRFDKSLKDHGSVSVAFLMQHDVTYLTPEENHGMRLFLRNCSSCHHSTFGGKVVALNNNHEVFFANNGLDMVYEDQGMGAVSGINSENGVFKIPSLRNIALTYPYMHDGRFETLEEVVNFYSNGVKAHENLDHRLRNPDGTPVQMRFDADEKKALIAFLESMTDMSSMSHLKYSDPWK